MRTISKLLVANRGEIALRIFRAAAELKIKTVAIYTYEDRYSLHRYKADEAYQIGKDTDPLKPYLDIDEIIKVAKAEGIDAIHPGMVFYQRMYYLLLNVPRMVFYGLAPIQKSWNN